LPFVVGFDEYRPGQPQQRLGIGEDPDHVGAALISLLSRSRGWWTSPSSSARPGRR
jgi:hypothetical protein